eukprot:4087702-Pleurochrysis_carterae.AAC.1
MDTYMPEGVPASFHKNHTPAVEDLPRLVEAALLAKSQGVLPEPSTKSAYQSLVGALLYCATQTRPDIAYAVGMLCRAMACPTADMMVAAKRVLCYLSHHRSVGLRYARTDALPLTGFSDSDWATRHSTSGHVFMYGKAAITWSSKMQPTVALSSCEAEIIAASEAAKEATYLRALLRELGESADEATRLHLDNKSAIDLAYNPEHHSRSKHIHRRHFFIREKVEELELAVPFVRSADNLADFFYQTSVAS